jgi:hypothetical protein
MAEENQGWKESNEQRQKRYEELYRYARTTYDDERKHVDEAEAKVARFFPLIVLLLGIGSIGVKDSLGIIKASPRAGSIFLIPYFFFYVTSISYIFAFLRTTSIWWSKSPSIDDTVIKYFNKNQYIDIIYSYSHEFLNYARETSKIAERKYKSLNLAYYLLIAAVALSCVSTIGYVIMQMI